MASRNISDLIPEAKAAFLEFEKEMYMANLPFMVTCTYRSQEEQDALWAKGRTVPGNQVTWVRHSKHTDRIAWDIAILKPFTEKVTISWDLKADVDLDSIPDYQEAATIGRRLGLRVGADFGDFVHFEYRRKS